MAETYETYVSWLEIENAVFADACQRDVTAPVPTCPGWSVLDLVAHHASYQTWITHIVAERLVEPRAPAAATVPDGDPIGWYRSIGAGLVAAFRAVPGDTHVWSVTDQASVSAWARRQASETCVHRWDAQHATGDVDPLTHADDYLSETFDHLLPGLTANFGAPVPESTIRLRSTDQPFTWTSTANPARHGPDQQDTPTDVTVTGTTSDLFLALWNRPNRSITTGDHAVLERWRRAIAGG